VDQKQFERLQSAVQWVVDVKRAREEGVDLTVDHVQHRWAVGNPIGDMLKARYTPADDRARQFEMNQGEELEVSVICASGCCLAGDLVKANGDQFIVSTKERNISEYVATGAAIPVFFCMDEENTVHRIGQRAMDLIGVTTEQGDSLFKEDNTAEVIVNKATNIARKYGHELTVI
jgi:hypothetical protein